MTLSSVSSNLSAQAAGIHCFLPTCQLPACLYFLIFLCVLHAQIPVWLNSKLRQVDKK